MEEEIKQENTSKKQVVRNEKGQIIQGTANPYGRPKGALNFSTKFRAFIEKVAEKNNMTAEEIEEQLLAVGYKRAKEGDYQFYKDIWDRVYGKPTQPMDHTTDGEKITSLTFEVIDGPKHKNNSCISETSECEDEDSITDGQ